MIPASVPVGPLSLWHFAFKWEVLVTVGTAVFNAAVGVWGINFSNGEGGEKRRRVAIRALMFCGTTLALGSGLLVARALRISDFQSRTHELEYQSSLSAIAHGNAELKEALDKLASAAHIATDVPLSQLVSKISSKLPKEEINNLTGNTNGVSTNQLGGVTAGTISNLTIQPSPYLPKEDTRISYATANATFTEVAISFPPAGDPKILFNGTDVSDRLESPTITQQMAAYIFEGAPQTLGLHTGHNRIEVQYGNRHLPDGDVIVTRLTMQEGNQLKQWLRPK